MAQAQPSGRVAATGTMEGKVRDILAGKVGEANVQNRAFGFSVPEHLRFAGKFNAQYATVKTSAAASQYEVPHSLGSIPRWFIVAVAEHSDGTAMHVSVAPVRRKDWTATTIRVDIFILTGSLDDGQVTLLVMGE